MLKIVIVKKIIKYTIYSLIIATLSSIIIIRIPAFQRYMIKKLNTETLIFNANKISIENISDIVIYDGEIQYKNNECVIMDLSIPKLTISLDIINSLYSFQICVNYINFFELNCKYKYIDSVNEQTNDETNDKGKITIPIPINIDQINFINNKIQILNNTNNEEKVINNLNVNVYDSKVFQNNENLYINISKYEITTPQCYFIESLHISGYIRYNNEILHLLETNCSTNDVNILCDIIFHPESLNDLLSLKSIDFISDFENIKKKLKYPIKLQIHDFDINKNFVSRINIPYVKYIDNNVNMSGVFTFSDKDFSIDDIFIKYDGNFLELNAKIKNINDIDLNVSRCLLNNKLLKKISNKVNYEFMNISSTLKVRNKTDLIFKINSNTIYTQCNLHLNNNIFIDKKIDKINGDINIDNLGISKVFNNINLSSNFDYSHNEDILRCDCLIKHLKINNRILENITLSINKDNDNVYINTKSDNNLLKWDIMSNIILDEKYKINKLDIHGKNEIHLDILDFKDLANSHLKCNFSVFYEKLQGKNDNKNCNLILNDIKFIHNNELFKYDKIITNYNVLNQTQYLSVLSNILDLNITQNIGYQNINRYKKDIKHILLDSNANIDDKVRKVFKRLNKNNLSLQLNIKDIPDIELFDINKFKFLDKSVLNIDYKTSNNSQSFKTTYHNPMIDYHDISLTDLSLSYDFSLESGNISMNNKIRCNDIKYKDFIISDIQNDISLKNYEVNIHNLFTYEDKNVDININGKRYEDKQKKVFIDFDLENIMECDKLDITTNGHLIYDFNDYYFRDVNINLDNNDKSILDMNINKDQTTIINIKNIDIHELINKISQFSNIDIDNYYNGFISGKINFYNTNLLADLKIKALRIDNHLLGDALLIEKYNYNNILTSDIKLVDKFDNQLLRCIGDFNLGDLAFNGFNIVFNEFPLTIFEPFAELVCLKLKGKLNGGFILDNSFFNPNIRGEVNVKDGIVQFQYFESLYKYKVDFVGNKNFIDIKNLQFTDSYNNNALFSGNFIFDNQMPQLKLKGSLKNIEVMNKFDNSMFYGQIFANGELDIFGPLNTLKIYSNNIKSKLSNVYLNLYASGIDNTFIHIIDVNQKKEEHQNYIVSNGLYLDLNINIDETNLIHCKCNENISLLFKCISNIKILSDLDFNINLIGQSDISNGQLYFEYFSINKTFNIIKGNVTFTDDLKSSLINICSICKTDKNTIGIEITNKFNDLIIKFFKDNNGLHQYCQLSDFMLFLSKNPMYSFISKNYNLGDYMNISLDDNNLSLQFLNHFEFIKNLYSNEYDLSLSNLFLTSKLIWNAKDSKRILKFVI